MDKEEILAMEAGNELDVMVATKVMGRKFPNLDEMTLIAEEQWKVQPACTHFFRGFNAWIDSGVFKWNYNVDDYSTNIAKASDMEETLYDMSTTMGMTYALHLLDIMKIGTDRRLSNLAKLIRATPEQRCKAALLAVMEEN